MKSLHGLKNRSSGVLLHPTSLPGRLGAGSFGPEARSFVDALSASGQSWWQMLPLNAPAAECSPYRGESAFAGNPLLISPDDLVKWGVLHAAALPAPAIAESHTLDFRHARIRNLEVLRMAFLVFESDAGAVEQSDFGDFCRRNSFWLDDYALFKALQRVEGKKNWTSWPETLRRRNAAELERQRATLHREVRYISFIQFLFHKQFSELRSYAHARGIGLIGDVPIFVDAGSADVWRNPMYFELREDGRPGLQAGVPPDYFSADGQLWGNPLYDWQRLREAGYDWWVQRFRHNLAQFDLVRIDHFRGFAAAWGVPAGQRTARQGTWIPGPGEDLFRVLRAELGKLPVIAEDLGLITPDVERLRRRLGFPGMRVLQFAFGEKPGLSSHLPHWYDRLSVAYTGTHDNDTLTGWYRSLPSGRKAEVRRYTRGKASDIHWACIQSVWASVSALAIVPMQDLLGLGTEARMNVPGTKGGNWGWKMTRADLEGPHFDRLARITGFCGRRRQAG
jgi:4-alpha-glucanotransferase